MEILIGLGILVTIAWLIAGPIFKPEPEGILGFLFALPWIILCVAIFIAAAYGIGFLVMEAFGA